MHTCLLALLLALAGCRSAEVTHYQVRKGAGSSMAAFAQERPRADDMPGGPAAVTSTLDWTLPKGWSETRAAGSAGEERGGGAPVVSMTARGLARGTRVGP